MLGRVDQGFVDISATALNATISGSKQIKAGIALDVFDNCYTLCRQILALSL